MSIKFIHLNNDWNAEPNSPREKVLVNEQQVILEFTLNHLAYIGFEEEERAQLIFESCSKFRLGETNEEGWYMGQCRFGKSAPKWGEFYQIIGSSPNVIKTTDWSIINEEPADKHYLFYLRDSTFECIANNYQFKNLGIKEGI